MVHGIVTDYWHINRGIPQLTRQTRVFSTMADDIKTMGPNNQLVKFADDLTLGVSGNENGDTSRNKVDS